MLHPRLQQAPGPSLELRHKVLGVRVWEPRGGERRTGQWQLRPDCHSQGLLTAGISWENSPAVSSPAQPQALSLPLYPRGDGGVWGLWPHVP